MCVRASVCECVCVHVQVRVHVCVCMCVYNFFMEAFFGNYCHVCKQLLCVRVCNNLLIPFLETVK